MRKLVFFFPWREVSGGPFYLARLANAVARENLYEVYYTDYQSGLCDSILEEKSIKVLKYKDGEIHFEIFPEEPVILVMAEYWAHVMPKVHPKTKIIFFNWHNECVPVLQRDWCATDAFIEKFLSLVNRTSSVFFCDKTHWLSHKRGNIEVEERYVPIIIPARNQIAPSKLVRKNERNIAVLGRLCRDKIYAVLDLMDNIVGLRDRVKTNVYIIGEGDHEELLFFRKFPEHIRVIRCGTMDIKAVVSLLIRKVDILFAMGTSVLEGATIRLPSVIIPNAMDPFECNRYPYLFESKGYSLGWYPEQIDDLNMITHTVEEIFRDIYQKGLKAQIGEQCYEYYTKNHMQNIDQFLQAINASTLTHEIFQEFVKKNINWKRTAWIIKHQLKKWYGQPYTGLSLLGFPIYRHTKTDDTHSNIYLCGIPLLRIHRTPAANSIYPLLLIWGWRVIQRFYSFFIRKIKGKQEEIKK